MSRRYLLLLLCAVILGNAHVRAECSTEDPPNYEKPDYCKEPKQPHLGCHKNHSFGHKCNNTAILLETTPSLKSAIVRQMNTYRNIVAKGVLGNLPAAGRMNKLGWDESLAELAKYAAMRCVLDPIKKSFTTTLASKPGYTSILTKYPKHQDQDVLKIMKSHLQTWYDQYIHTFPASLLSGISRKNHEISHFLQLMTGMNSRVGCAITVHIEDQWKVQLMTCLYGCSKHNDSFAYDIATSPATNCKCKKVDREFKNLCPFASVKEDCGLLNEEGKLLAETLSSDMSTECDY